MIRARRGLALTLIVALAVVGVGCGSGEPVPADRAERVPVVSSIKYAGPVALAADATGVWVLDYRGRLARVGVDGDVVVAPGPAAAPKLGRDVDALVRVGRDLWVADARRGLLRFDARTARPLPGSQPRARAVAVAASRDALWAVDDFSGALRRLELASGRLSRPVRLGQTLRGVAAGGSGVWVVDQDDGTVTRVDGRRLTPNRDVAADGTRPFHAAVGGGRVWVSDDDGATAYDGASLRRLGRWTAGVGATPYVVADATGGWAVSAIEPVLVRLDSAARVIRRIRLPSAGYSLAVAGGVVWVSGEGVIHRVTREPKRASP